MAAEDSIIGGIGGLKEGIPLLLNPMGLAYFMISQLLKMAQKIKLMTYINAKNKNRLTSQSSNATSWLDALTRAAV